MNVRAQRGAMLALLVALPMSPFAATPQASTNNHAARADEAAVARLEQRWVADIASGNRQDLASILADDYRDIDWRGQTRGKAVLLAGLRRSAATQRIERLDVRVWGDTAVATGINRVHSSSHGWTVLVPFTDVFARIDGRWRAVSSQETVRKPAKPASSP